MEKTEMEYNVYQKDVELSLLMAEKYKKYIKPNDCYTNVWRLFSKALLYGNFKIAFGYVACGENHGQKILVRHAFLLNEKKEVVDPTLPMKDDKEYYVVMEFSSKEYLDVLTETQWTDIISYPPYFRINKNFCKWGFANNLICIG
jgi:hypothetical protein